MKVLIVHPEFENPGGISGLYSRLQNEFSISTTHIEVAKRIDEKGFISKIKRIILDYCRFLTSLRRHSIDLILLNPSLNLKSFIRDGIYVLIGKMYKKKIVIFFHGWQKSFEKIIERYSIWMFQIFFGRCDAFIVLSKQFADTLRKWGIKQKIYKEVNVIGDDSLKGFDIENVVRSRQSSSKWRILFLSRLLKSKGIYETLEAVNILKSRFQNIELLIAGDGEEMQNVKTYVLQKKMCNVNFLGYVVGKEKEKLFEKAHIFILPSHSEGMPGSIIEAIAFGLPVITRSVGGLNDFFENDKHGFITKSGDPKNFANLMEKLILNSQLYKNISYYNYSYGQKYFLASDFAKRLENIFQRVINEI